jgi:hypothetical protein
LRVAHPGALHGAQDALHLAQRIQVYLRRPLRVLSARPGFEHPLGHLIRRPVGQPAHGLSLPADLLGSPLHGLLSMQRVPPIGHYYQSLCWCFMGWVPNSAPTTLSSLEISQVSSMR